MDKEFVEKYKLQEAVKRFRQINEYTFITSPLLSEDDDEPQDDGQDQQKGSQGMPPDGGGQMQGGGMPPQGGQQMPPMPPMPPQGDQQQMPPMQGAPADPSAQGMPPAPPQPDQQQPGDEVIDVDDLTKTQEKTDIKVSDAMNQISRLTKAVEKFSAAIDMSNAKIDDLKAEFEKRNPSEQEKLNIRSQASYPYAEMPRDFWERKAAENPFYEVTFDNGEGREEPAKKYEIRASDLDNLNYKEIADSFDGMFKLDNFLNL